MLLKMKTSRKSAKVPETGSFEEISSDAMSDYSQSEAEADVHDNATLGKRVPKQAGGRKWKIKGRLRKI